MGFEDPNKSDLFLHPDPSTVSIIPWRPSTGKVIRMFCNIKYPDGTPYQKDCRQLLKDAVKKAKELLEYPFMSTEECARQSGFLSLEYFCREFKKATGITPAEYRKK